jgi:hypothetical protein
MVYFAARKSLSSGPRRRPAISVMMAEASK